MRILIINHYKLKQGSYAYFLLQMLLQLYSEKQYKIAETASLAEAGKIQVTDENLLLVTNINQSSFPLSSFINNIRFALVVKKLRIQRIVQFADNSILPSKISQLIIPKDIDKLAVQRQSSSILFAAASQFEQQQLLEKPGIANQQICILPAAAGNMFQPVAWSEKQLAKMTYAQGKEYFVVRGDDKTATSFLSLLKAFSGFKKWQHSSMKLIVAGKIVFAQDDEWKEKLSTYRYRDDVVFMNDITDEEYAKILSGAYVFIHTPVQDNDILPLLEAMQCQTPGISFTTETIKEYAANAVVMIEPGNYEQLSEKMILLYKDEKLRSNLIEASAVQAAHYSKENAMQQLEAAIQQSMNS